MMPRLLVAALASALITAACVDAPTEPIQPPHAPSALIDEVDLTGVLEFAELPDLSVQRHAEKYIRAAEGGSIELNGFRVDIPAGALPADTLVTIDLPSDVVLGKRVLMELGPHGIQFNEPVTLTVPLEGVIIPSGALEVARWEGDRWVPLGGTISADGRALSSETPHFSMYSGHVMAGG